MKFTNVNTSLFLIAYKIYIFFLLNKPKIEPLQGKIKSSSNEAVQ